MSERVISRIPWITVFAFGSLVQILFGFLKIYNPAPFYVGSCGNLNFVCLLNNGLTLPALETLTIPLYGFGFATKILLVYSTNLQGWFASTYGLQSEQAKGIIDVMVGSFWFAFLLILKRRLYWMRDE